MMRTAAVYIRVSTDEQTEYSPDAQLKAARKYAAGNEMALLEEHVYIDEGISGKNTKNRTAFNRMIGTAKSKPKPFDVILLWKFSRFARNREDSILYKSLLRRQLGIEVISITENIGDDKMSILIEAMIEAMDEYYSINLAEEVKKGMTEKAVRGEYQTGPPLGYRKPAGLPLEIVETEAEYIRFAFQKYLSGDSFFSIANQLNELGAKTKRGNRIESRTVEYILNNPVYKGYARWSPSGKVLSQRIYDNENTLEVRSGHPPIISEDEFDQVKKRLTEERKQKNTRSRPAETKKHYLSGLLHCGNCGSVLVFSKANQGFQCMKYAHGSCKESHFISTNIVENVLLDELDRLSSPVLYQKSSGRHTSRFGEQTMLEKEISSLKKMLERSKQAYLSGIDTIEEYETLKKRLSQHIHEKNGELRKVLSSKPEPQEIVTGALPMRFVLESDLPDSVKNTALQKIIEKIIYQKTPGTIEFFLTLHK